MKQIVKNFNNLIQKTIFKVKNKTNINFRISSFNKYLITIVSLLFFYLFYLSIPVLYGKNWVQTYVESKLLNDFKINLSTSAEISYRILPAPHFLVKDSKVLLDDSETKKSIAEIKNLKVFLSQNNFFDKEKLSIKDIAIQDANFSLLRGDFKLLNKVSNNQFSNKKIKVNRSTIFFKDHLDNLILITKIDEAILFFDDKKQLNLFNLKGEVYSIPFTFDLKKQTHFKKTKEINFIAKQLKLHILDKSIKKKDNFITGKNTISFMNSTINTIYDFKDKLVIFTSANSKIKNYKFNYNGELSINPFNLNLNIDLDNHKISKLFDVNSILTELVKTELLFNDNISVKISMVADSNIKNEIFQNAKINFNIINGKINLDNTKFTNNEIGSLKLVNSNIFLDDNNLILNTNILVDIKNSKKFYTYLNTNKSSRKDIYKILINLDYNLLNNEVTLNNIEVDNNNLRNQLFDVIEKFNKNNPNNTNKSRRIINEMLNIYDG